jgi:hypothetical protein
MKSILLIFVLAVSSFSWSQTDSTRIAEVRAVIDQLFDGMRQGDSTKLREVFHPNAQLFTSFKQDDVFQLHDGSVERFITVGGSKHDEVWDERISNVIIRIDDGLAHAWMDYTFHLGDQFSHEGVNSITLVDVEGNWKIHHIVDTRRR